MFVMTVPMVDSPGARLFGLHWHAFLPEHINYFTEESLTSCLSQQGFTLIYTSVYADNLAYPVILVLAQKSQSKTLSEGVVDSPKKSKI